MILLDDAQSTVASPSSRLYENPLHYWCIHSSGDHQQDLLATQACFQEITNALNRGEFVVAAFAYELGRQMHRLSLANETPATTHPLVEAWSFLDFQKISKQDADNLIEQKLSDLSSAQNIAGVVNIEKSLSEQQFAKDIAAIQEYIRSGDSYQINHTYRIKGSIYGMPLALYSRLRSRQPGRFGAYIEQDDRYLLSQSPELFIAREGQSLTAMPMKGTASALSSAAHSLSDDPKNQAENVMIVDLLRNDLSRISVPGTVSVPHLFEVSRHGDVLQMTSTIQSQIQPHIPLFDIFEAVFPCGSVTGAPKKRSMEIIQELEGEDRGYYCGALGWLDPNGNFSFSVPIRTIEIVRDQHTHASLFTMGVGAGITIDSNAQQEWQECQIKSAFLTELPSATGLFETIAVGHGAPLRLKEHLHRISQSARAFNIVFHRTDAEKLILQTCRNTDLLLTYRLRLDLSPNGELSTTITPLDPIPETVKIFWAHEVLQGDVKMYSGDPLLRHKISDRTLYDQAWQEAVKLGGFDAVFINEKGYVTEGGRSSIFVKPESESQWLTPPLSAGLLPGIMRATILADPLWNAREANLTIQDVSMADEIILSNALRGAMKAHF